MKWIFTDSGKQGGAQCYGRGEGRHISVAMVVKRTSYERKTGMGYIVLIIPNYSTYLKYGLKCKMIQR